jgi:protein-S-isoprenylcysteine O-methyltransferase Ste14
MKAISKFAFPVLLIALLVLLIRGDLLSSSPYVIAAQILAIALNVWTRRSFGAGQFSVGAEPGEGRLLTNGPFKFIRHPMFAAALLFLWASILGHWSLTNAMIGLVVTGFIAVRIITEEQLLRTKYPEYVEYSKKTKRIIPYLI